MRAIRNTKLPLILCIISLAGLGLYVILRMQVLFNAPRNLLKPVLLGAAAVLSLVCFTSQRARHRHHFPVLIAFGLMLIYQLSELLINIIMYGGPLNWFLSDAAITAALVVLLILGGMGFRSKPFCVTLLCIAVTFVGFFMLYSQFMNIRAYAGLNPSEMIRPLVQVLIPNLISGVYEVCLYLSILFWIVDTDFRAGGAHGGGTGPAIPPAQEQGEAKVNLRK